jgi:hypothetical protein
MYSDRWRSEERERETALYAAGAAVCGELFKVICVGMWSLRAWGCVATGRDGTAVPGRELLFVELHTMTLATAATLEGIITRLDPG